MLAAAVVRSIRWKAASMHFDREHAFVRLTRARARLLPGRTERTFVALCRDEERLYQTSLANRDLELVESLKFDSAVEP